MPSPGLQNFWSGYGWLLSASVSFRGPSASLTPAPTRNLPAVPAPSQSVTWIYCAPECDARFLTVWPGVAAFTTLSLSHSAVGWVSNSASLTWVLEGSVRPC